MKKEILDLKKYWEKDKRKYPGMMVAVKFFRRAARNIGTMSNQVADSPIVVAEINHGRWVANCPYCNGAEMVDLEDPRFFCISCDMVATGGKWLRVQIPKKIKEIEAELLKRPDISTMIWHPRETIADLKRQNKARGIK